jgi:hypothetical protein
MSGYRVALASCNSLAPSEVDDRPFAVALRDRGCEVETPAWDDAAVDWSSFDAVLPRTTWDYMHRAAAFLDWAAGVAAVTRLYNPLPVVLWNLDKTYLRDLAGRGVATIPSVWLEGATPDDTRLRAALAQVGAERGFLKPIVGASAVGALRFAASPAGIAAAAAHLRAFPSPRGWILQPYLEGVERAGEVSAVFLDGAFSHAVRKVPPAGDFRVQDDYGATDHAEGLAPARIALAARALEAAAEAVGESAPFLYARADFLADGEDRLLLVELELVEPSLFFRHAPEAPDRLAAALVQRLESTGR